MSSHQQQDAAAPAAAASANNNNNNKTVDETQPVIMTFDNSHLLKFNCHDAYSTANKTKQAIMKMLPPPLTQAPPAPMFPGLTRVGKNPRSDLIYFNFDSEENLQNARKIISEKMKTRSALWTELPITEHDKSVNHRGACATEQHQQDNNREGGQRRQRDDRDNNNNSNDNNVNKTNNLAPWSHLSYDEQIAKKEQHCKKVLRIISRYHCRHTVAASRASALLKQGTLFDGVIASPITHGYRNNVQVTAGYGSDGQPTLGFNAGTMIDGKTALFPVEEGNITSHPAVSVLVKVMEKEILAPIQAKYFEPLEIKQMYSKVTQTGFWRRVHLRFNGAGDALLDFEVNDTQVREKGEEKAKEIMDAIKQSLIDFAKNKGQDQDHPRVFEAPVLRSATEIREIQEQQQRREKEKKTENDNNNDDAAEQEKEQQQQVKPLSDNFFYKDINTARQTIKIASLQFHIYNGPSVSEADCPREVLFGSPTLTETLAGLHFDLSPTDFFQVNRDAMNLLIDRIRNVATLNPAKTTLLDLCSGTGTLGLAFAKNVKKIVGIELVATAVENAKKNATRNGVENAHYICGRVENELPKVLQGMQTLSYYAKQQQQQQQENNENNGGSDSSSLATTTTNPLEDVVAILDPPRCGVPNVVLKSLRNTPGLKTLIYISCDQRALETQCEPLTKEKTNQFFGEPFIVDSTFGVDLFPQTNHVEMIVVFKRAEPDVVVVEKKVDDENKKDEEQ